MFQLLGFLFVIIIAVLFIGLAIIGSVFRKLFGFGRSSTSSGHTQNRANPFGQGYSFNSNQQSTASSDFKNTADDTEDTHAKRKKLFAKDDGEYVDFEEVKE